MNLLQELNPSNSQQNEQTGEYVLTVPVLELEGEYAIGQEKDILLTSNCNTTIKCHKISIATSKQIIISNINFESHIIIHNSTKVNLSNCNITNINSDENALLIINTQLVSLYNIKIVNKNKFSSILIDKSKATISNLFVDDSPETFIFCQNSSSLYLKDSTLTNGENIGIFTHSKSQIEVQNCKFSFIKRNAIYISDSSAKILDNVIQNVDSSGIVFDSQSTGLIQRNQIKNIIQNAIFLNEYSDANIIENDISYTTYPSIGIINNSKALISKNKIANVKANGIAVRSASDVKIEGCEIIDVEECGISASVIKKCHVTGNFFENCKIAAVEANNGSKVDVTDNTIVSMQKYAFYTYESAFINAENNRVNKIGKAFVMMTFGGGGEFVNNLINNCPIQKLGQTSSQFFLSKNGNFKGVTNIKSRESNEVFYENLIISYMKCMRCNQKCCNAFLVDCKHKPLCSECAWKAWAEHGKCPLCRFSINIFPKCSPLMYDDKTFIKRFKNNELKKIYLEYFDFLLFPYEIVSKNEGEDLAKSYLFGLFLDFKFITYHFYNNDTSNRNANKNSFIVDFNSQTQICDAVFCMEKKCIIVEKVRPIVIFEIVKNINEQNISIINTNINIKGLKKPNQIDDLHNEIDNFCSKFSDDIKINVFVENTIYSIAGYMIQRFSYPTDYFKDPSFFNNSLSTKFNYKEDVNEIANLLNFDVTFEKFNEMINLTFNCIENKLDTINERINENNYHDFYENEFINLRKIYENKNSMFYKVFHIKSKYIYVMKKIHSETYTDAYKYEIDFCSRYSCRFMIPFYGFLKVGNKITGFIYEYMANNSLNSFVLENKDKITEQYSLMVINRILQGIEYLQSNNLIYRDLKPSNILIDHDFIPYIADFETIRHPDREMTTDFGSSLYKSPEQDSGENVSFKTDIYSFGLIMYFIFEKKKTCLVIKNHRLL